MIKRMLIIVGLGVAVTAGAALALDAAGARTQTHTHVVQHSTTGQTGTSPTDSTTRGTDTESNDDGD